MSVDTVDLKAFILFQVQLPHGPVRGLALRISLHCQRNPQCGKADNPLGEGRGEGVRVHFGRENLQVLHCEMLRARSHLPGLSNAADSDDETAGNDGLLKHFYLLFKLQIH